MPYYDPNNPLLPQNLGRLNTGTPDEDPFYQRLLTGVSRGLEPLAFLQQLAFGATEGIATGEWGRLGTILKQAPTYAPFGARPDMMSGEELLRSAFNVQDDFGAKWGGLALDFLADPMLAGGFVRGAATAAGKLGATGAARTLISTAERLDYLTSLKAPASALGRAVAGFDADVLGNKLSTSLANAGSTVFSRLLDRSVPIDGAMGLSRVAESLVQNTLQLPIPFWKRDVPDMAGLPGNVKNITLEELAGSGSATKRKLYPNLDDALSIFRNRRLQVLGDFQRGMTEMDNAVASIIPDRGAAYRQVLNLVGDHLDNLGGVEAKAGTDVLDQLGKAKRTSDVFAPVGGMLQTARNRPTYVDKLKKTAANFGLDEDALIKAADRAAAAGYSTILRAGFNASEYDQFMEATVRAGARVGLSAEDARDLAIRKYGLGEDDLFASTSVDASRLPSAPARGKAGINTAPSKPPLAQALTDNTIPIYRRDSANFSWSADKPHGIYASIDYAGFNTPHLDAGEADHFATLTTRNPLRLTDERLYSPRVGHVSSVGGGIVALSALAGPAEYARLSRLSKDALTKELQTRWGSKYDFAQYYDKNELLEAYGSMLARERGHDAIIVYDKATPQFSEVIALDPAGIRPSNSGVSLDPSLFQVPGAPQKTAPGAIQPRQDREDFIQALDDELSQMPSFSAIPGGAKTWLRNMFDGYARKVMQVYQDPQKMEKLVVRGDIRSFKQIRPEAFQEAFATATGKDEVGNAVANYVANGGKVVYANDILEVAKSKGANLSYEQTKEILSRVDPEFDNNQRTLEILRGIQSDERGAFAGRMFGVGSQKFTPRDLTLADEDYAALLEQQDALVRMGSLGSAISKSIGAKEVLSTTYKELSVLGAVKTDAEVAKAGMGSTTLTKLIDGTEYLKLPDGGDYGELSGKWIPSIVWRDIAQVSAQRPDRVQNALQRTLGLIRGAYLSPLPTAIRNGVGNLALLNLAGLGWEQIANPKYWNKATEILKEYSQTGYHAELDGVEGIANFIHDAGLVGEVSKQTDAQILGIVDAAYKQTGGGKGTIAKVWEFLKDWDAKAKQGAAQVDTSLNQLTGGVLERPLQSFIGEGITNPTRSPALGGFLTQFQVFEDKARVVAFLATKDKLMAKGIPLQEAKQQAAKFANSATLDYTNAPHAIQFARNNGLALFPAFPYYMAGRVLKGMWENPRPLAIQDKVLGAANSALADNDSQSANAEKMLLGYWGMKTRPLLIPSEMLGGKKGEFLTVPTNYFLPAAAFSPESVAGIADQMSSAGIYRPLVDLYYAWAAKNGVQGNPTQTTAAFRGGDPLFLSTDSTAQKVLQSAAYLGQAYGPGTYIRTVVPIVQKAAKSGFDQEGIRYMEQLQNRYLNLSPGQIAAKLVGVNTYQVGAQTAYSLASKNDRTLRDEIAALRREYEPRIAIASRSGSDAQKLVNDYQIRLAELTRKYQGQTQTVMQGLSGLQGR